MTIQGKSAATSIVNGNGIDRVFQVLGGANAVFSDLTIEGGMAQDDGTASALPGTTVARGGGVLVQDDGRVTFTEVRSEEIKQPVAGGAAGILRRETENLD